MMDWKTVRLPWMVQKGLTAAQTVALEMRAKKKFGKSITDLTLDKQELSRFYRDRDRFKLNNPNHSKQEWDRFVASDASYQRIVDYYEFSVLYYEWLASQPEMIALRQKKSFCGEKLNKPGTLIELTDGRQFLIGTIGPGGGSGNMDSLLKNETVERYALVRLS